MSPRAAAASSSSPAPFAAAAPLRTPLRQRSFRRTFPRLPLAPTATATAAAPAHPAAPRSSSAVAASDAAPPFRLALRDSNGPPGKEVGGKEKEVAGKEQEVGGHGGGKARRRTVRGRVSNPSPNP